VGKEKKPERRKVYSRELVVDGFKRQCTLCNMEMTVSPREKSNLASNAHSSRKMIYVVPRLWGNGRGRKYGLGGSKKRVARIRLSP